MSMDIYLFGPFVNNVYKGVRTFDTGIQISPCARCGKTYNISELLDKLGYELNIVTSLYCDKTVELQWSESADNMKKVKLIDLKYHFVEECADNETINCKEIKAEKDPCNGFTKYQMKTKFERLCNSICVKPWN